MKSGKYISFLLITLLLASCNSGFQNFNKRKYTKLRSRTVYFENQEEVSDTEHSYEIEQPPVLDHVEDLAEEFELDEEKAFQQEENIIEESNFENAIRPTDLDEIDWRERRDFNNLSKEEQEQALEAFKGLFFVGLFLFVVAVVILLSAPLVSTGFAVVMWILSLVALNRVRNINGKEYSNGFRTMLVLAKIVAWVGIVVSIVTIVGGVVLLILWATRVISF